MVEVEAAAAAAEDVSSAELFIGIIGLSIWFRRGYSSM